MRRLLLFFCFLILIQCAEEQEINYSVFFGGQIINPSSKFVSLYKYDQLLDSLPLDKQNRFSKRYDSLNFGLFTMEHLPEKQIVLIEAGDSIWTRANMVDFNTSIGFSGKGSAKNNFMMDIYSSLQDEVKFLSSAYALSSKMFKQTIDSLLNEKKEEWIRFENQNDLSILAQKVTQASYIYPYANRLERYALIRGKKNAIKQDSSFFNFRKYLVYGENDLAFYEPYITYLISYLSQEALLENQAYFQQKNKTDFNIRRLQVIDEKINNPVLRNNLARTVAYEELVNFENHRQHDLFLQFYFAINTSPVYLKEILTLHQALQSMESGQFLPEALLETHLGEIRSSNLLFKGQPTVLYFWSQTQMNHFKRTQEKVAELKNQFPKYRFVGICIQPYNELVRDYQKIMNIDPKNQFAVVNFEKISNDWVVTLLNKGIVLDKNGKILEGFGNFTSPNFENKLKKFYR